MQHKKGKSYVVGLWSFEVASSKTGEIEIFQSGPHPKPICMLMIGNIQELNPK